MCSRLRVHIIFSVSFITIFFYLDEFFIFIFCSNLDAAKLKERGRIFRDSFLSKVYLCLIFNVVRIWACGAGLESSAVAFPVCFGNVVELI